MNHDLLEIFMKRQYSIVIISLLVVVVFSVTFVLLSHSSVDSNSAHDDLIESKIMNYTYQIVKFYPHDPYAFTQGLVFEDGVLYEGTGLYGKSQLRRIELETGNVTQDYSLSENLFGEGITIFEDKIIQLTWRSNIGFVYDKYSFELLQTFNYSTEGWGLTHDGSSLIMSIGNETLYYLDPQTLQIVNQVNVHDNGIPVTRLNELEYINGSVYANIWQEDTIMKIDPQTGNVTGRIDLTGLKDLVNQPTCDVLNGIAYDSNENRLFVTGKNWSKLFEIKLIPKE